MSSLTDYAKNVLARAICGRAPLLPSAVFAALGTGGSDPTGISGEAVGNGYARQRVTFTGSGVQQNAEVVRFTFTAAAGSFSHIGMFDAASGGNALTWSPLTTSVSVAGPGTVSVNPGAFTMTAD